MHLVEVVLYECFLVYCVIFGIKSCFLYLLGGHNVKSLDLKYMRSKMSMVSQEPSLFACSIKDNITYGKEASSFEEVSSN